MTDIRRIAFVCPKCNNDSLSAKRHETILHPLFDDIDLDLEDLAMSGDIAINDSEHLDESYIVSVVCSKCCYEVVPENWYETYEDPAEPLIAWLKKHDMLPEAEIGVCKFCKKRENIIHGSFHQEEFVCSWCWDERLRRTE
jgi:hypothetical protein